MTTRGRNFRVINGLGRGLGAVTALFLRLGVPGLDAGVLAPFGLAAGRLPALDLSLAVRILAVALVPTPRLVLPSAAFAQADPPARSSCTGIARALWFNVAGAHGSVISQGTARGERTTVLPGRLSNSGTRSTIASLPSPE